jgi:hypothetical protein
MEVLNYRAFNHTSEYVTVNANGVSYPDDCSYEIIGNVLTSRIYGKDLSVLEIASSGRVAVTLNDIYSFDLKRDNATNTVSLSTINEDDSIAISSSNTVSLSGYNIETIASNLEFNAPNIDFKNVDNYNLEANNITFATPGAKLELLPSNLNIGTTNSFTIESSNNGYIRANSNLLFDANSKAFLTLNAVNGIASMRGDTVQLLTNTPSGISEAITLMYDEERRNNVVYIDGNLVITGTFETQDIINTNLVINDKIIELSFTSRDAPTEDGTHNDSSGIKIDGYVSANSNFASVIDKLEFYKKSILWKYNKAGMDVLAKPEGISYVDNDLAESYWDVRGGGIQMSVCKQDTDMNLSFLSYGFRINEYDQLELYKRSQGSNGEYGIKRISRWGGCGTLVL